MAPEAPLENSFCSYFNAQVKRVLTQMDRDPDSPTYGCFDRNHWHYKMRDFPSSILQQGAVVLEALRRKPNMVLTEPSAREWVLAAINALSRQAEPKGAVSEYFPFEDSYPAAAFGLYAVSRILFDWQRDGVDLGSRVRWTGLKKLAGRLAQKKEREATNQYAAGLAALSMASHLPQLGITKDVVNAHAAIVFSLQNPEGWFLEYGGPDFGYLTVTIDALVDYHDATQDPRAIQAIDQAVMFLASLVGCDNELPWTLNSRNTDYVVPYGLVRIAARSPLAAWLVHALFQNIGNVNHAIWATDDRYHLHYIFSSVTRSIPYLDQMMPPEGPNEKSETWLPGCGIWVHRFSDPCATVYVGAFKGGTLRVHREDGHLNLYENGWRLESGTDLWAMTWWQGANVVKVSDGELSVRGGFVPCKPMVATPAKHIVLRMLAKILGNGLTVHLKKLIIFRGATRHGPGFVRAIRLDRTQRGLIVEDNFSIPAGAILKRAPRQNLRHVASADSFSVEDNQGMLDYLGGDDVKSAVHSSKFYRF